MSHFRNLREHFWHFEWDSGICMSYISHILFFCCFFAVCRTHDPGGSRQSESRLARGRRVQSVRERLDKKAAEALHQWECGVAYAVLGWCVVGLGAAEAHFGSEGAVW